jgi:hypothetical protein
MCFNVKADGGGAGTFVGNEPTGVAALRDSPPLTLGWFIPAVPITGRQQYPQGNLA